MAYMLLTSTILEQEPELAAFFSRLNPKQNNRGRGTFFYVTPETKIPRGLSRFGIRTTQGAFVMPEMKVEDVIKAIQPFVGRKYHKRLSVEALRNNRALAAALSGGKPEPSHNGLGTYIKFRSRAIPPDAKLYGTTLDHGAMILSGILPEDLTRLLNTV